MNSDSLSVEDYVLYAMDYLNAAYNANQEGDEVALLDALACADVYVRGARMAVRRIQGKEPNMQDAPV